MPSGFDPLTTPGNQTTNVAVISHIWPKGSGTRVPAFVTKGGADLNFDQKWRAAEYDGRRHIAVGTEEVVMQGPSKMTATAAEFSEKAMAIAFPGMVDGTPIAAGLALAPGDYIEAPWYELTLKSGEILRWKFDFGFVANAPTINTKDGDEATMQLVIEARVDPTKAGYNTDLADYTFERVPAA